MTENHLLQAMNLPNKQLPDTVKFDDTQLDFAFNVNYSLSKVNNTTRREKYFVIVTMF